MNPWRWLSARVIIGSLAVVFMGAAAVAVFESAYLPIVTRDVITDVPVLEDRALVALGVGGLLLLYAVMARWMKAGQEPTGWLSDYTWEQPEREAAVADESVMAAFEARIEGDRAGDEPFQARLRDLLISVFARELGTREAAEAFVDAGEWTEDRYAAAFVSATGEVDFPWYRRLYAWLYPGRAYEHRVYRTLRAVERVAGDRLVSYGPPQDGQRGQSSLLARLRARLEREGS